MSEPVVNIPESPPNLSKSDSRTLGCVFFVPIVALIVYLPAILLSPGTSLPFPMICFLPIVVIFGIIGIFSFGPRLLPGFYLWIESHPIILYGAISSVCTILIAFWASSIYSDIQAAQRHETLGALFVAMFVGTPMAFFIGPVVGAIGGFIGGMIGDRLIGKSRKLFYFYGVIGGGIAGLAAAALLVSLIILGNSYVLNPK